MATDCLFCGKPVGKQELRYSSRAHYGCPRCGYVTLTEEAADDFEGEKFSESEKLAISIALRNAWERAGRPQKGKALTLDDLHRIVEQSRPLSPTEKMDQALLQFERQTAYVGSDFFVNFENDYPLYYCREPRELSSICGLLIQAGFVMALKAAPGGTLRMTASGYQRLREVAIQQRMSRQCFVAMWFGQEMDRVFREAIKPAIEFLEPGEREPRFNAVRIDNVEHTNDINDEIIAQIRRSRFMVCDLTGYRGGVYFEAGFAYGLGLNVIYTCRKDWSKEEILRNDQGQEVTTLLDGSGNKIPIRKEGIHFDLAHRNRIEWEPDKLSDFRVRLETRIKSIF